MFGIKYRLPLPFRPDIFTPAPSKLPYLGQSSAYLLGGPNKYLSSAVRWDTTSRTVEVQYSLNGKPFGHPTRFDMMSYRRERLQRDQAKFFREAAVIAVSSQRVIEQEALEIQVPLKVKSKTFKRIFGGDKVGLRVNGEISINGELRRESNDKVITQQGQAPSTNFKIDQKQRFTITGNVGDKVTVRIDQDSERLFEFENAVKLEYTGTEDEIIQKIEAGNIALDLPGTSLATFSGQNKGLFGLKSIAKIGALKLTTIASLEKGKKNKLKKTGGEESTPHILTDVNFSHGQFFVLDTTFLYYLNRFDANMVPLVPANHQVLEAYVYQSVSGTSNGQVLRWGFALENPPDSANVDSNAINWDSHNNFYGNFKLLVEGTDYDLDKQRGILSLKQSIPASASDILGISYRTSEGNIFGTLTNSAQTDTRLVTKLLRGNIEDPASNVWKFMLKNWYSLQGTNITPESFEGTIYRTNLDPKQYAAGGVFFTNLLGIDQFGPNNTPAAGGDGKIDNIASFIDFTNGILKFPDLTPFSPSGYFRGSAVPTIGDFRAIDSLLLQPEIYTTPPSSVSSLQSKFTIEVHIRSRSNVMQLGIGILEGSEEVTLNGRTLSRGRDYTIDYFSGTLTILDAGASTPGADLEVTYESGQIFQLDRKTLLGARAEYELWDESFIGATVLSLTEKPLDQRIRLGSEPISNKIWDVNTRLVFKPDFLTKAMDALPIVATEEASRVQIEGEIAQVFPNPNNMSNDATGDYNGVAYVDDFESAKRIIPLPLTRQSWTLSAYPLTTGLNPAGDTLDAFPARLFMWYNPFHQEPVKNIWPAREVNSNVANTVQTMELSVDPKFNRSTPWDTLVNPQNSWAAITKYLGSGFANQSESKYLELWVRNTQRSGKLFVDLGRISEREIPMHNNSVMAEGSFIAGTSVRNPILGQNDDTGIDGVSLPDPPYGSVTGLYDYWDLNGDGSRDTATITLGNQTRLVKEPFSFDNFDYSPNTPDDYTHINGTQGNKDDNQYPDTEDLNGNGSLDIQDDFYRFVVDLSNDAKYVVGGQDNIYGWRLYRIPIADSIRVGNPSLQNIFYARIGLTNCIRKTTVAFAEVDIVGNEWQPPGTVQTRNLHPYNLEADVLNTYDNRETYNPPPGVSGQEDPNTNIRLKEQALRIKVKGLLNGETSYLVKTLYEPLSFRDYRKLKMFIYGGAFPIASGAARINEFDKYKLYFKLRMGIDTTRAYYEISKRIYPGWDERNKIDINLDDLPTMKYEWLARTTARTDTAYPTQARLLPDGTELRVIGRPSQQPTLKTITFMAVAIENRGRNIAETDNVEVWADELRVTDVKRTPGTAYRVSTNIDMAHIVGLSMSMSQTDGNFHNVNVRSGSHSSSLTGMASATIQGTEFIPKSLGLNFPVTMTYNQTITRPDYLYDGDISLDRLTGKSEPVWKPYWRYLTNLNLLDLKKRQGNADTLLTLSKGYSIGVSNFSRTTPPEEWWEKWLVNRWTISYNHAESYNAGPLAPFNKSRTRSGGFNLTIPIDIPNSVKPLRWTSKIPILREIDSTEIGYLPNRLSFGVDGSEQTGSAITSGVPTSTWAFGITKRYATGIRLFQNMNLDYSLSIASEAVKSSRDRFKIAYAAAGVDLNDSLFHGADSLAPEPTLPDSLVQQLPKPRSDVFEKFGGYYFRAKQRDQNVSASWNPQLFEWLTTDYTYSSAYSWSWQQPTATSRNVQTASGANQVYTLRLGRLLGRSASAYSRPVEHDNAPGMDTSKFQSPMPGITPIDTKNPMGDTKNTSTFDPKNPTLTNPITTTPIDLSGKSQTAVVPPPVSTPTASTPTQTQSINDLSRPGRARANQSDSTSTSKTDDSKRPKSKLDFLWAIVDRLDDISVNVSRRRTYQVYAVKDGQADYRFQLGLINTPGLGSVSTATAIPTAPTATLTREYATRSGFHLSDNFSISLDHSWLRTENISITPSQSLKKSVFLLQKGDDVPTEIDVPNFSIRWSGLETLGPWKAVTQTVTLENGYQASSLATYSATQQSRNTLSSVAYSTNWNPLIGVNVQWKKGISSTARYTITSNFSDGHLGNVSRQRTTQKALALATGYTFQQGFRLPFQFWPFNGKRFKNQTEISVGFNETSSTTEQNNHSSAGWGGFVETLNTSTYTFTPKVTVTFSRTVTGYVQYDYGVTKSTSGGTTRINAFKFNVRIEIRG